MTVFVLFPLLMAFSALAQGKVKSKIVFTCENEWRIDFVTLEKHYSLEKVAWFLLFEYLVSEWQKHVRLFDNNT